MTQTLAIRIEHGVRLAETPAAARSLAAILIRPCFAELARLSGRNKDRWSRQRKPDADAIVTYLLDASLDAIALDTPRSGDLVASAEIENGSRVRDMAPPETRHSIVIALPLVPVELDAVIRSICELAGVVHAAAGFVALEPTYGLAHRVAVGGSRPKERPGISQQRFRERRGRGRHEDRLATELASVEWATFLGPGHLARLDLAALRASGAFAFVTEVTPQLAYLQVSEDPTDDLTEGFEAKLQAARRALAPVLMDVSAISLE